LAGVLAAGGKQEWRAYATGPDEDLLLDKDFNKNNPHYGQFGLGTQTWEGDAWKIGGGTNWGWYAYDLVAIFTSRTHQIA
jgi:methanol dehydrogenase (cytochrome c) subunit 1